MGAMTTHEVDVHDEFAEQISSSWLAEIAGDLRGEFPPSFFASLDGIMTYYRSSITDLEYEMRDRACRMAGHLFDSISMVEMACNRLERSRQSLYPATIKWARDQMGPKAFKEEIEHKMLGSLPYRELVTKLDLLSTLLSRLRGDSYGRGGERESVRHRDSFLLELSTRERKGIEDEKARANRD